jgi:hypothetical protein
MVGFGIMRSFLAPVAGSFYYGIEKFGPADGQAAPANPIPCVAGFAGGAARA